MINLIYGAKGSGKTEKIIACANDRVRTSKGNVVYITDREGHSGDVDNAVRFIDIKRYGVDDGKSALSFIKGLLAGNYDITDVYIDGLAKFIKKPVTEIEIVKETPTTVVMDGHSSRSSCRRMAMNWYTLSLRDS